MTRVVPFDPARTPAGQVRLSLHDAYSEPAIQSFVEKLRELAAVSPDTCATRFRALDSALARILDESSRATRLANITREYETSATYALRLSERWAGQTKAAIRADHQRLGTLLQRLATERPAALVVIEKLLTDMLDELARGEE